MTEVWTTVERPGYLGKLRDVVAAGWDVEHGAGNLPDCISRATIKDYGNKGQWWRGGSIEDFYQKNKVLQVRR